jgi:2,3-bisphosphoglycerate-dependent phosphoglycerate mutase
MKNSFLLFFLFVSHCLLAQETSALVAYKKGVPTIDKKGVVTMPGGKNLKIDGFLDKKAQIFFFVRHAEKDTSRAAGSDPDLTPVGRGRAQALVRVFNQVKLNAVYSTAKKRTRYTAEGLAFARKRKVAFYDAQKQEAFLKELTANPQGQRYMVVGHSNTLLQMVRILKGENMVGSEDIPETDYSRIYIVTVKKGTPTQVLLVNY